MVSSNVLAENLHTERHLDTTPVLLSLPHTPVVYLWYSVSPGRHLETTYYVTSARQMTDFAWYRRSGVRINVAARDISLVPACRDVINMAAASAPGTSLR